MVHIILSKTERIMPALLLSMYIRNTTKRTEFVLCGQKNYGYYTKTTGNIEQIYAAAKKQNNCLSNSKNLLYLQCDAAWGSADKTLSISIELGIYEQCRKILKRSALFLYSRV